MLARGSAHPRCPKPRSANAERPASRVKVWSLVDVRRVWGLRCAPHDFCSSLELVASQRAATWARLQLMASLLVATALAQASGSCEQPTAVLSAASLRHGGVCPASELSCPACPAHTPIKCPQGLCTDDVRTCTPNVLIRGYCNSTHCDGVEHCHVHATLQYACWEQAPSKANASFLFPAVEKSACGYCTNLLSHYPCSDCCGTRAAMQWNGTYRTDAPYRQGGGVWMEGSRWVCLLKDVALGFNLSNPAAGLIPPPAASAPPPLTPATASFTAATYEMPAEYNLS